jgi:hypothetical protein
MILEKVIIRQAIIIIMLETGSDRLNWRIEALHVSPATMMIYLPAFSPHLLRQIISSRQQDHCTTPTTDAAAAASCRRRHYHSSTSTRATTTSIA